MERTILRGHQGQRRTIQSRQFAASMKRVPTLKGKAPSACARATVTATGNFGGQTLTLSGLLAEFQIGLTAKPHLDKDLSP